MVKSLSLIIKEEEKLVLDYRTADGAAKHVPAKQRPRNWLACRTINTFEPVFPLVRIQLVVPEILPEVAMEAVCSRLDRGTHDASLKVAKFG